MTDLRANKNFGTYKGAIYENIVGDMLAKQGYKLFIIRMTSLLLRWISLSEMQIFLFL